MRSMKLTPISLGQLSLKCRQSDTNTVFLDYQVSIFQYTVYDLLIQVYYLLLLLLLLLLFDNNNSYLINVNFKNTSK